MSDGNKLVLPVLVCFMAGSILFLQIMINNVGSGLQEQARRLEQSIEAYNLSCMDMGS
jgi:hypothetical protein